MNAIHFFTNPLGQPIRRHQATFAQTWGALFMGLFLLGLGVGLYTGLTVFLSRPGEKAGELLAAIPFWRHFPLLTGAFFLFAGTLQLVQAWQNWPLIVDLYEGGMIYTDRRGTWRIPWNEVESLYLSAGSHHHGILPIGRSACSARLDFHRGGMLIFDHRLSQIEQLCLDLETYLTTARQAERLDIAQAGRHIKLGKLSSHIK